MIGCIRDENDSHVIEGSDEAGQQTDAPKNHLKQSKSSNLKG
jgi:hypothetical protein